MGRQISNADKAACAAREVKMRRATYPRFVHSRRMSQAEADRETEIMAAIAFDYSELAKAEKDAERLL